MARSTLYHCWSVPTSPLSFLAGTKTIATSSATCAPCHNAMSWGMSDLCATVAHDEDSRLEWAKTCQILKVVAKCSSRFTHSAPKKQNSDLVENSQAAFRPQVLDSHRISKMPEQQFFRCPNSYSEGIESNGGCHELR